MNRRSFILGSSAILAAPSIVRASSLMPVSVPKPLFMAIGLGSAPSVTSFAYLSWTHRTPILVHVCEEQWLAGWAKVYGELTPSFPRPQPQDMA